MFSGFIPTWQFTKRFCYFLIIFFMFAQATPAHARDVRVGVIDIQAAVTATKDWKKEFASFKTKFQKEKVKIAAKEKNLKKMIENLNKQSMVLSPELKKKKEEALIKKKKEFERHVQDKNEEFAKSEKAITNKILKKMVKIVKDLGESKKFTMILENFIRDCFFTFGKFFIFITPKARFILLPAQSEGDDVILYHPEDTEKELARICFSVCLGKGQKDVFSAAQYVRPKSSGQLDALGLQITTAGTQAEKAIEKFKNEHDSESALYLQGLCDRVAEDLAQYIHNLIRLRAGYKKNSQGERYSPGYAALTDLYNNKVIWEVLKAEDLGIELTDANEFNPPSTTAAVICFHSDAGYT